MYDLITEFNRENRASFLRKNLLLFRMSYMILNKYKGFNMETIITLNTFLLISYLSFAYYSLKFSPEDEFESG